MSFIREDFNNRMSEWLLFNAKWESIQQMMTRTSYSQWNDDDVRFVLDQQDYLDLYSASSMKQQSAGRHVAPLGHIILIRS
jgi:predicted alpha/beta hydrolase